MPSQSDQTDKKSMPFSRPNQLKSHTLQAAHTYIALLYEGLNPQLPPSVAHLGEGPGGPGPSTLILGENRSV